MHADSASSIVFQYRARTSPLDIRLVAAGVAATAPADVNGNVGVEAVTGVSVGNGVEEGTRAVEAARATANTFSNVGIGSDSGARLFAQGGGGGGNGPFDFAKPFDITESFGVGRSKFEQDDTL